MRIIAIAALAIALAGCAASMEFIDRTNGATYQGVSGSTAGSKGTATATIEGETYSGTWVYTPSGGGYSLGTSTGSSVASDGSIATATVTSGTMTVSAHGKGLLTLRGDRGGYVRCVFNFNAWSDTGIGECARNDGRLFDLTIDR